MAFLLEELRRTNCRYSSPWGCMGRPKLSQSLKEPRMRTEPSPFRSKNCFSPELALDRHVDLTAFGSSIHDRSEEDGRDPPR